LQKIRIFSLNLIRKIKIQLCRNGTHIDIAGLMKIVTVSSDDKLIGLINRPEVKRNHQLVIYNESKDLLDVVSFVCMSHASVLIADDDFLKPDSAHLLENLRKLNPKLAILFITSDPGIELGKKISQLGIFFYGLKPLSENELEDSIRSVTKLKTTITQY
jgi:response regulator of citrate/malate metabolism